MFSELKRDFDPKLLKEFKNDYLAYEVYDAITKYGYTDKIVKDGILFMLKKKGNLSFVEKHEFYNCQLIPYFLNKNYSYDNINNFLTIFSEVCIDKTLLFQCMSQDSLLYIRNYIKAKKRYGDETYVFILLFMLLRGTNEEHSIILVDKLSEVTVKELTLMTLVQKEREFLRPILDKINDLKEIKELLDLLCIGYYGYKLLSGITIDIKPLKDELFEALDYTIN